MSDDFTVRPKNVPCLAQLCYWGSDPVIAAHDHEVVSVVASAADRFIILMGIEETEASVGNEADLILLPDDAVAR